MKKVIALLLLFFSPTAFASDNSLGLHVEYANSYFIAPDTVHFNGWLTFNIDALASFTLTGGVEFGDGQSFVAGPPYFGNMAFDVDHKYAPGSYVATTRFDAVGTFAWYDFDYANDGLPVRHVEPLNFHYAKPFDIQIASHAPEPSNLAMMLAGLGVLGFMARRRK
jgi:hypothetical protein